MKYLNDYIDHKIKNLLIENGAFYAFNKKQFVIKKVEGVNYHHMGAGLYVPRSNAIKLSAQMDEVLLEGIRQDVEENGIKDIIWRELANYESQIVNNCEDTIKALEDYPVEVDEIIKEFNSYMQHCIDNDLF